MTLVSAFASLSQSLIGPAGLAGAAVTFTRTTPGAYDRLSGHVAPVTVTSWQATALEVGNEQGGTRSTNAQPGPTGQCQPS